MTDRFRQLAEHLKRQHQWRCRLSVRCVKMSQDGRTSFSPNGRITITVNEKRNWNTQKDTLIHEFAHAEELDAWVEHGDGWSKLHGKYYRAWEAWEE